MKIIFKFVHIFKEKFYKNKLMPRKYNDYYNSFSKFFCCFLISASLATGFYYTTVYFTNTPSQNIATTTSFRTTLPILTTFQQPTLPIVTTIPFQPIVTTIPFQPIVTTINTQPIVTTISTQPIVTTIPGQTTVQQTTKPIVTTVQQTTKPIVTTITVAQPTSILP
jgi:hypothetical protein